MRARIRRFAQRGAIQELVLLALPVMLGALAASADLSRVGLAAQKAQDIADAAVLACLSRPPSTNYTAADQRIDDIVTVNHNSHQPVTYDADEVVYYDGGDNVPGYGVLPPNGEAVTVVTHSHVTYYFAAALGLTGTEVTRRATGIVGNAAGGSPMAPMWVDEATTYTYGETYNLRMADGPHYPGIPGNFGWLQPLTGNNDFDELLSGYNLSPEMIAANRVTLGMTLYGLPGNKVGQWEKALGDSGTGRLARARWPQWINDTFDDYQNNNPRLLIIPMIRYMGGNGSNAEFLVTGLACFWLESIPNKDTITGRFIKYIVPGEDLGGTESGLFARRVVG